MPFGGFRRGDPAAAGEAAEEIRNFELYDYVLVNDDLDAFDRLHSIVKAERSRRERKWTASVRKILDTFGQ